MQKKNQTNKKTKQTKQTTTFGASFHKGGEIIWRRRRVLWTETAKRVDAATQLATPRRHNTRAVCI